MKKILPIIFLLMAAIPVFAQHERVMLETSPLARQLLTNDTASQWLTALGVGQITNLPAMSAGSIIVGNASGDPASVIPTGAWFIDTNGVTTLATNNSLVPGSFVKGVVNAQGLVIGTNTLLVSDIPGLPGSIITSGIIGDFFLSTNIPRLNGNNTFSGVNNFIGTTEINGTNINSLFGSGDGGGGGSVTSVGMSGPAVLFSSVTGSPVTTIGTLQPQLASQTSNTFFRGPFSGSPGTPFFGQITQSDLGNSLFNAATNTFTGINNFTGGANFVASQLIISGTNSSANGFTNLTFNSTNPASRARINWNGLTGLFTSPDEANFSMFGNIGHGGHGNGVEWQWTYNQMYLGPVSGGHTQYGLAGDGGDTFFLQRQGGDVFASNPQGWSAVLGFHGSYWPNSGTELFEKWNVHATNINTSTGEMLLRFLPNTNDNGSEDGTFVGYFPALDISSAGYGNLPGGIRTSVATTTPGTNYAINFSTAESQQISIGQNTSFSLTNVSLTNRQQEVDLFVYPGPFPWNLSWINNATNILWENEAGNATAPSSVAASNVMHIHFTANYGTVTNIFGHVKLAKYSAPIDPDAAAFISITGATNSTTNNAINNLVVAMKADGSWTNLQAIYPYLGYSAAVDAWNLRNTNIDEGVFHGSVTHTLNGITGDGSTGYMDTQFNPSTATNTVYGTSSASIGVYCKTASVTANTSLIGAVDGSSHRAVIYVNVGATDWQTEGLNNNNNPTYALPPTGGSFADNVVTTLNGSNGGLFLESNNVASAPGAGTGVPAVTFYVLAEDNGGGFKFSNANIAFAFIGGGMTPTQVANIQADILAFETALGRQ